MPRTPPRVDPLSSHGIRRTVLQRLLKPAVLKVPKNWGRELAILKKLQVTFPHDLFWLQLSPAERLDSLCWFMSAYGKAALTEEWKAFLFRQAEEHKQAAADQERLDTLSSIAMMESTPTTDLPPLQPKRDALAWADSV